MLYLSGFVFFPFFVFVFYQVFIFFRFFVFLYVLNLCFCFLVYCVSYALIYVHFLNSYSLCCVFYCVAFNLSRTLRFIRPLDISRFFNRYISCIFWHFLWPWKKLVDIFGYIWMFLNGPFCKFSSIKKLVFRIFLHISLY